MAKISKYIVPVEEQKEFQLLVQRANRRMQSNLKYIEKEGITSEAGQRALVGDYTDRSAWSSSKTVFSRSKTFESEKEYKQFRRHIEKWGGPDFERSPDKIKEGYYKAIIQALTTTAIDNGNGVLLKSGKLPGNLAKHIRDLSLEQMSNFFAYNDITENIESQGWRSDEYIGVDRGEFVEITKSHINSLKQLYPTKSIPKAKTRAKRKKSSSKRKRKK